MLKRNIKLFFKDKGLFFTALITPAILLVLYATFLGNVYKNSFIQNLPGGIVIEEKLIDALVAGQLISSILAVSCVTVAFCSNFLMVQDRANGTAKDLAISPVKPSTLSLSYYIASLAATLIICLISAGICLIYQAAIGWYLTFGDVLCILSDVFLLVLFGTALSSIINYFLSTQGQISAVGSIISAGYGFICGAYMPISSFGNGMQKAVLFLPGTYGTSLLRNHALGGVFNEMENRGIPSEAIIPMQNAVDCNLKWGGYTFTEPVMYLILGGSALLLVAVYVAMNFFRKKSK
jgi:multidrug/hemolysin transport system permease protein